MSGMSISFTAEIVANAKSRGISLSPEDIESINENLSVVTAIEDGAIRITSGPFLDLSEAVDAMSQGYGTPIEKSAGSSKPDGLNLPANATATQRAIETNRVAREGADALKRKQAEDLVKVYGSPWSVSGNLTHAAFITNVHPELAQRLRREAGDRK